MGRTTRRREGPCTRSAVSGDAPNSTNPGARIQYRQAEHSASHMRRNALNGSAHGVVKVLTVPGKDRILGVTIVAEHAGDIIAEFVGAMKHGIGLNKILSTIHVYPTLMEANRYAAGAWKRAHAPARLLRLAQRYHAWALD